MTNFGIVARSSEPAAIATNRRGVTELDHRPALPGPWVYVLTGDPQYDDKFSPEWLNDFYFLSPVAFRHGLDGLTDMIGVYDLSLGAVSGDIAFMMPVRWADQAPLAYQFPLEVDTGVWTQATQVIDPADPSATATHTPVRIFWPLVADPIP